MSLVLTKISIYPNRNPASRVRANVIVVFNDELKISGIRVIEGRNGLFVSYPGEKQAGTDRWFNFVYILSPEPRNRLQDVILEEYRKTVHGPGHEDGPWASGWEERSAAQGEALQTKIEETGYRLEHPSEVQS